MPCTRPLAAYRALGGGVEFDSRRARLPQSFLLPCGQCQACRLRLARDWTVRIMHESMMHERSCFVTLTYDDEHLPRDRGLHVRDWQLFAKRVRNDLGPFRFYACGEYGPKTLRPHFHACIFGEDFEFRRSRVVKSGQFPVYEAPLLREEWGNGNVSAGELSSESAAYCARYVMVKARGLSQQFGLNSQYFRSDGVRTWSVRPEFSVMSRRPGVGASWLEKFSDDVYPDDQVILKGKRFRPPRFYDERLEGAALEELKVRRVRAAARHGSDLTPERLRDKEVCLESRINHQSRGN